MTETRYTPDKYLVLFHVAESDTWYIVDASTPEEQGGAVVMNSEMVAVLIRKLTEPPIPNRET